MDIKNSKYLKFIDYALELCKEIPRHFSKFSNKIFCNHQKIVLLVLKQKLRTTYRDLVEILKISEIPMYIGLKKIPHHTTLVKFAKKIKPKMLSLLLPYRKAKTVGLDGTGFEVDNKSLHYQIRTERTSYRKYIKLGISADLDKQLIMRQTINKGPRNDQKDFMSLVKDIKTNFVCADKGYDSYKNHKIVIKDLSARSLIKSRNYGNNKIPRPNVKYRRRSIEEFDDKIYHQRSKVETIFSVIKRKYGSCLRARTFSTQKKEVLCKLIAYNVDKLLTLYRLVFGGFQQSPLSQRCIWRTKSKFFPYVIT